jgi:hypothetical protein
LPATRPTTSHTIDVAWARPRLCIPRQPNQVQGDVERIALTTRRPRGWLRLPFRAPLLGNPGPPDPPAWSEHRQGGRRPQAAHSRLLRAARRTHPMPGPRQDGGVSVDPAQPGTRGRGMTDPPGAIDVLIDPPGCGRITPCHPSRWRRDVRHRITGTPHRPQRTLENTAAHNSTRSFPAPRFCATRSRRQGQAPLREVDLRSSLDPDPSLAYVCTEPGMRRNRSQLRG